jgi:hypothetical protein
MNHSARRKRPRDRLSTIIGSLVIILSTACSGGNMLHKGNKSPSLSTRSDGSIWTIDGRALDLNKLHEKAPVVLVLLRGFS